MEIICPVCGNKVRVGNLCPICGTITNAEEKQKNLEKKNISAEDVYEHDTSLKIVVYSGFALGILSVFFTFFNQKLSSTFGIICLVLSLIPRKKIPKKNLKLYNLLGIIFGFIGVGLSIIIIIISVSYDNYATNNLIDIISDLFY